MTSPPVLLAIEASQRSGGVALRDRDGTDHVEPLDAASMHDDAMMPAIDRLYSRVGLSPSDTDAIGVSTGPGGFTGLRVAVSTAKMLAESLGTLVCAVPTSLVVAERWAGAGSIAVILASRAASVWVTRLDRAGGDTPWKIGEAGRLVDADAVRLDGLSAVLGDRYLPQELRDRCGETGVAVAEPIFDPLACLAVTARHVADGLTIDPLALVPIYARPPAAVANVDRDRYRT